MSIQLLPFEVTWRWQIHSPVEKKKARRSTVEADARFSLGRATITDRLTIQIVDDLASLVCTKETHYDWLWLGDHDYKYLQITHNYSMYWKHLKTRCDPVSWATRRLVVQRWLRQEQEGGRHNGGPCTSSASLGEVWGRSVAGQCRCAHGGQRWNIQEWPRTLMPRGLKEKKQNAAEAKPSLQCRRTSPSPSEQRLPSIKQSQASREEYPNSFHPTGTQHHFTQPPTY